MEGNSLITKDLLKQNGFSIEPPDNIRMVIKNKFYLISYNLYNNTAYIGNNVTCKVTTAQCQYVSELQKAIDSVGVDFKVE